MADRPILMSGPMVRALLDGRKTQTRRVITRLLRFGKITEFGPSDTRGYDWHFRDKRMLWNDLRHQELLPYCPYGQPGDRLWPSEHRFMRRADSRLTLQLTDVRVERVQDIKGSDLMDEGAPPYLDDPETGERVFGTRNTFAVIWNAINAKCGYGWDANPWVWALSFTVIRANIDQIGERDG